MTITQHILALDQLDRARIYVVKYYPKEWQARLLGELAREERIHRTAISNFVKEGDPS